MTRSNRPPAAATPTMMPVPLSLELLSLLSKDLVGGGLCFGGERNPELGEKGEGGGGGGIIQIIPPNTILLPSQTFLSAAVSFKNQVCFTFFFFSRAPKRSWKRC